MSDFETGFNEELQKLAQGMTEKILGGLGDVGQSGGELLGKVQGGTAMAGGRTLMGIPIGALKGAWGASGLAEPTRAAAEYLKRPEVLAGGALGGVGGYYAGRHLDPESRTAPALGAVGGALGGGYLGGELGGYLREQLKNRGAAEAATEAAPSAPPTGGGTKAEWDKTMSRPQSILPKVPEPELGQGTPAEFQSMVNPPQSMQPPPVPEGSPDWQAYQAMQGQGAQSAADLQQILDRPWAGGGAPPAPAASGTPGQNPTALLQQLMQQGQGQ